MFVFSVFFSLTPFLELQQLVFEMGEVMSKKEVGDLIKVIKGAEGTFLFFLFELSELTFFLKKLPLMKMNWL